MNKLADLLPSISGKTSRRQALKGLGLGTLGLASAALLTGSGTTAQAAPPPTAGQLSLNSNDIVALNLALNLEYLEAQFYTYATTSAGIEALGIGVNGIGTAGKVTIKADPRVDFATPALLAYTLEIAADEQAHVQFLRGILGRNAAAQPAIDLLNSFTKLGQAAGIVSAGEAFDPFDNEIAFFATAAVFEDLGVTAYRGLTGILNNRTAISYAAGIMGTEAYHASVIRAKVYESGGPGQLATQMLADAENSLDGTNDAQGVADGNDPNITPTTSAGLVFSRTQRQVLDLVYLGTNASKGGFFPKGVNL